DPLCGDGTLLDLDNLLGNADPGTWSVVSDPAGSNPAVIDGNFFGGNGADPGDYILRYTLDSIVPGCPEFAEEIVTVVAPPSLLAGPDANACVGNNVVITAFTDSSPILDWWTNGTGVLEASGTLTADYIPSFEDTLAGQVTVYILASDSAGVCTPVLDSTVLTIIPPPLVELSDSTLSTCQDPTNAIPVSLTDLIVGSDTVGTWIELTSSGVDISDPSSVNFQGIDPGVYTFTYTTNSAVLPCTEKTFMLYITVEDCSCPGIEVLTPHWVCQSDTALDLSTLVADSLSGTWSIIMQPSPSNPGMIDDTLFTFADAAAGTYILRFQLDSVPMPGCPDTALAEVTVRPPPQVSILADTAICDAAPVLVSGQISGSVSSVLWITAGDGQWSDDGVLTTVYIPGSEDVSDGVVQWSLVAIDGTGVCPSDTAFWTLGINSSPYALLSPGPAVICNTSADGSVLDLMQFVIEGDQNGIWADTDSAGVDLINPDFVDFDGIPAGTYSFTYTTQSAVAPCSEATYTIEVVVEDCTCPDLSVTPTAGPVCNMGGLALADLVLSSEPGVWSVFAAPSGSAPAVIEDDSLLNVAGADSGLYTLVFVLAAPEDGCPDSAFATVQVEAFPDTISTLAECSGPDTYSVTLEVLALDVTAGAGMLTFLGGTSYLVEEIPDSMALTFELANGVCINTYTVGPVDCSCALEVAASGDVTICAGDSVVLSAEVTQGDPANMFWLISPDTVFSESISVNTSGTYVVVINDLLGCLASDTVEVVIAGNLDAVIVPLDPNCPGENDGALTIESVAGAVGALQLALNNGAAVEIDTLPYTIAPLSPGSYSLELADSLGCSASFEFDILPATGGSIELGPDQEIPLGDSVLVTLISDFAPAWIHWEPPWTDSLTISRWFAPVSELGISVQVADDAGCTYRDSLVLTVFERPEETGLYVPNVFSPNGDQVNDRFTIYTDGEIIELNIFDRWGNQVFGRRGFPAAQPLLGWDGRFSGQDAPAGVYVYVAVVRPAGAEAQMIAGDVTLIR
ncbi:MAG: gliding motility-associated C-terminal domain-containing protein, partial [Saprospiraceae bacterium]|nr:gliding motility-associated C-terminal domain-containing protein [Saprospiraceae bacterium]